MSLTQSSFLDQPPPIQNKDMPDQELLADFQKRHNIADIQMDVLYHIYRTPKELAKCVRNNEGGVLVVLLLAHVLPNVDMPEQRYPTDLWRRETA